MGRRTPGDPAETRSTIALAALLVLVLGILITAAVLGTPVVRQFPAEVTMPDEVAGLTRIRDDSTDQEAYRISRQVNRQADADTAAAGVYANATDPEHRLIVTGVNQLVLDLDGNLDVIPAALNGEGYTFAAFRPISPGPLGGTARCGSGTVLSGARQGTSVAICLWADHGSLGAVVFDNRRVDEAARLFPTVRAAVLRRV